MILLDFSKKIYKKIIFERTQEGVKRSDIFLSNLLCLPMLKLVRLQLLIAAVLDSSANLAISLQALLLPSHA